MNVVEILWMIFYYVVFPGVLFVFFYALFMEWVDRKIVARIQGRIGPVMTGKKGILQPLADVIKLFSKETITPDPADRLGFRIIPYLYLFVVTVIAFMLPSFEKTAPICFEGDAIVFMFLMLLLGVFATLAGYFSNTPLALMGAERETVQLISYELPLMFALATPLVLARGISLSTIVEAQNPVPFIVLAPFSFFIFLLCGLAELEIPPFDVPEAESEIVGGWIAEYSGPRLAMFRIAKDIKIYVIAAAATVFFLGGPLGPSIPGLELVFGALWFLVKTLIVLVLISIIHSVFPRYRVDMLPRVFWRSLIILAILQLVAAWLYVNYSAMGQMIDTLWRWFQW